MTWLKLVPSWAYWALALLVVAGGQQLRVEIAQTVAAKAQTDLANYRTEVSERDRLALEITRVKELSWQAAADKEREEANAQLEIAQADIAAAGATADGLRVELARLKRNRPSNSTIGPGVTPGASATAVLADLLEEVEREGRAMAEEAQRRGVNGSSCERRFDSLSGG
jgi:beta-glucosidase-like glycosyl hydrolase